MSSGKLVRDYFDRQAERFDRIYEDGKPWSQRMIDGLFRGVVRHRLEIVRALAPRPGAWSVLDVGCGSGRFSVALAELGAQRVVGIDVAERMVELARADAEAHGVGERCEFIAAEYLATGSTGASGSTGATDSADSRERFDNVLALGYFDYLSEPLPHLRRMINQCCGHVFASFPKRYDFRVPTRLLRIRLGGGFVRFYSRGEVERLARDAGVARQRQVLIDLGRDYFLVVNCVRAG